MITMTLFNLGDNGSQDSCDGSYRSIGRSADTLSSSGWDLFFVMTIVTPAPADTISFLHQQNLSVLTEVLLSALRLESEVQVLPLGCSGTAVEQQRTVEDIGGRAPAEASEAAEATVSSASSVPRSRTSTWRGRMGLASSLSTMSWQWGGRKQGNDSENWSCNFKFKFKLKIF